MATADAADEDGYSVGVVDLRSLSPVDMPVLTEQARRTGRVVVLHEASTFMGFGAEIAGIDLRSLASATCTHRCCG